MADSGNLTPPPGGKKEISTEQRMLFAFVLVFAILTITQMFLPQPKATPQKEQPKPAQQAKAPTAAPIPVTPAAPGTTGGREETVNIETDLYRVAFSNKGGVVTSWLLKKYRDRDGKPLELVNKGAKDQVWYPFQAQFKGEGPQPNPNYQLHAVERQPDGLGVTFTYNQGGLLSRRTYRLARNSYRFDFTSEVARNGQPIPHYVAWRGGFGDFTVQSAAAAMTALRIENGKLQTENADAAKSGWLTHGGSIPLAGIQDNYFAVVFLAKDNQLETQTYTDDVTGGPGTGPHPHVGVGAGGEGRNEFSVFAGPKDLDLLRSVDPRLENIVDFGWFWFIAKPLFLALNWVNDRLTHNYGWAIILLTIVINLALWPLKMTQTKSAKKMAALQPQIKVINEKYANIKLNDPRKQQQNEEIMALYSANGVNPAGGCLPLLLQFPFFIGFFNVLRNAIELRGAEWLWVTDLSQPETLPVRLLPLAMIASQFLMQKMTPAAGMDPTQQKMMLIMPLVLGFTFYNFSSGLVLYWLTGNLIGIGQQLFTNRFGAPADPVKPAPVTKGGPGPKSSPVVKKKR